MKKPNIEDFREDWWDTYDYDGYADAIDAYEDEQRDLEIEKEWENEDD